MRKTAPNTLQISRPRISAFKCKSVFVLPALLLFFTACSEPTVSINDCGENTNPAARVQICTKYIELAQNQPVDSGQQQMLSSAYMSRANALQALEQHTEAIDDLTTAIELNPRTFANYLLRAISYSETGNYDAAIEDLTNAMRMNFRKPLFLNLRALQYAKTGQYSLALDDYNESIERKPEDVSAYIGKAKLLTTASDIEVRDTTSALEIAEAAVSLSRSDRTLEVLAYALAANSKFSDATDALEEAIELLKSKALYNPDSKTELTAKEQRIAELEDRLSEYRDQSDLIGPLDKKVD